MSDKKISQLTAASALTGAEEVAIVQSGSTVKTTTQDIADLGGGSAPYTVFEGFIFQEGTAAPTLTILRNTTGLTFTPRYNNDGNYSLKTNVVNSILAEKTAVIIGQNGVLDLYISGAAQNVDNDEIYLGSWRYNDGAFSPQNDRFWNTFIEIRIYP